MGEGNTDLDVVARELDSRPAEAKRYRVLAHLGHGAGGDTFEAEYDPPPSNDQGSKVVLKRLAIATAREWKLVELFEREARVLAGLTHPSIPKYRESFVIEQPNGGAVSYLVHDFAPGKSLRAWVETGWRPTDEAEVVKIGAFLLDVLCYLHARHPPVLHRDIKPANVIRSEGGVLALVDFGAVRDQVATMSGTSTIVGTYGYMAPEQFRGHAVAASDVYGVAATMLYLLSGRPPTEFPQEKLRVAFRGQVNCSPNLAAWIERALEPAPEDRFRSAQEALTELRGGAGAASQRAPRSASGPRVAILAGALGLAFLGAGGAVIAWTFTPKSSASKPIAASGTSATNATTSPISLLPPMSTSFQRPLLGSSTHPGGRTQVYSLAIARDDKQMVTATDGMANLWDLTTMSITHALTGHEGRTFGAEYTHDGRRVVSAGGRSIRVWDPSTGKPIESFEVTDPASSTSTDPLIGLLISPDDKTFYVARGSSVKVIDAASHQVLRSCEYGVAQAQGLALSPSGDVLAVGGKGGFVKLFNTSNCQERVKAQLHGNRTIGSIAFAPDGVTLATAGDDGRALLLDTRSINPRHEMSFLDEVWSVSFTPTGHQLVATSADQTLKLMSTLNGQVLTSQRIERAGSAAAFTHDGSSLIVAVNNGAQKFTIARRGSGTKIPVPTDEASWKRQKVEAEQAAYFELKENLAKPRLLNDAAKQIDLAIAAHPEWTLPRIAHVEVLFREATLSSFNYDPKGLDDARRQLEALSGGKKRVEWWVTLAALATSQKDYATARDAIQRARAIDPKEPNVDLELARVDFREGRYKQAVTDVEQAFKAPCRPHAVDRGYYLLDVAYQELGDIDAADAVQQILIARDRDDAFNHGNYALFLLRVGLPERAIDEATTALSIMNYGAAKRVLASAHVEIANTSLYGLSDLASTGARLAKAIDADPTLPDAYYVRAAMYRAKAIREHEPKHVDAMKKDLEKVLALDPEFGLARGALLEVDAVRHAAQGKRATK